MRIRWITVPENALGILLYSANFVSAGGGGSDGSSAMRMCAYEI